MRGGAAVGCHNWSRAGLWFLDMENIENTDLQEGFRILLVESGQSIQRLGHIKVFFFFQK